MRRPRRPRRPKRPAPPGYLVALPCVVLAVDPAATSGWAILVEGTVMDWGVIHHTDQRKAEAIVARAANMADEAELPLVVIGEDWPRGGRMGLSQHRGLAMAWGFWRAAARHLSGTHRAVVMSRVLRVQLSTWRSRFGLNGIGRAYVKDYAVRKANALGHVEVAPEQHDAAEAILIGLWAAKAGTVGESLPKTIMRARGLLREARA